MREAGFRSKEKTERNGCQNRECKGASTAQKLRLRGELRLKCNPRGKTQFEDVERDFRDAVELALSMSAKSLESSATTSLTRLLRDTNRRDEARALLADIYNWFTEGFDTSDLKDAQGLLEQLSQ
jgi:predicted ATPase